jgi:hypothetical protein
MPLAVGLRSGPVRLVGKSSGSRWGSRRGAVSPVPADGRPPAFHDDGGQFLGHDLGVVVVRPRDPLLGRRQVPENRWTQAVEVDPRGHTTWMTRGHDRTTHEKAAASVDKWP